MPTIIDEYSITTGPLSDSGHRIRVTRITCEHEKGFVLRGEAKGVDIPFGVRGREELHLRESLEEAVVEVDGLDVDDHFGVFGDEEF